MDESTARAALLDVVIAEFAALRAEIDRRSGAQDSLFVLNLTIAGAVTGLLARGGLSASWDERVLYLILPTLTPALALGWWDHGQNIAQLGLHIRGDLRQAIRRLADPHTELANLVLTWERGPRERRGWSALGLQISIPFVLFPLASLAALGSRLRWAGGEWHLWVLLAACLVFTAVAALRLWGLIGGMRAAAPARIGRHSTGDEAAPT